MHGSATHGSAMTGHVRPARAAGSPADPVTNMHRSTIISATLLPRYFPKTGRIVWDRLAW